MRFLVLFFLCISTCFAHEHNSTPNFFVGELGEKWEFGSDHLPVGVTVDGIHIACWNILDSNYIGWIEANGQGLKKSAIMRDHIFDGELTLRERKIMNQVLRLLDCQSILGLEETNSAFFDHLLQKIPSHIAVVTTFPGDLSHGDLFLYNKELFDFVSLTSDYYGEDHGNTWMILTLKEKKSGKKIVCIQSHIPGGPNSEVCRKELAEACAVHFDCNAITVVMGDQNRSPDYFQKDLEKVDLSSLRPMRVLYPTHVNTLMQASWIDNLFVSGGVDVKVAAPEELLPEMNEVIEVMWEHFPYHEEMKKMESEISSEEILKAYQNAAEDLRLSYLESEKSFDLILTLRALQFSLAIGLQNH